MKAIIIFFAAALVSPICEAVTWTEIGSVANTMTLSVDGSSIRFAGTKGKAWFLWNYTQFQPTTTYPVKYYKSAITLEMFDCSAETNGSAQAVYHALNDGAGDVVQQLAYDPSQITYREAVPDSIGDVMLKTFCGLTRSTAPK